MIRLLEWLAARRSLTLLLVVVYSALVILTHELIQQIVLAAYERFTRERVNLVVQITGLLLVAAFGRFLWHALRPTSQRSIKLLYLAATGAWMAASWRWLFYTDVEAVHFPQYAMLAILIFPLTRRFGRAVFYAALIGVADECVQFYVAHPTWNVQLDLNDMIYNLIGAGLGCTMLYVGGAGRLVRPAYPQSAERRLLRSPPLWITAAIILLCGGLRIAGLLSIDPLPDGTKPKFVLRRGGPPPSYWRSTNWGKTYHDVLPYEAIFWGGALLLFYSILDACARRNVCDPVSRRFNAPPVE